MRLLEVDEALFGKGGVVRRVMKAKGGKSMLEGVMQKASRGGGLRQPLLDLGAAHFGMDPLDLGRAVPGLVNAPFSLDESLVSSFYQLVQHQLEEGWALVMGEAEPMALVEALYVPGGPQEGDFKVVVGIVPGRYLGVVKKGPELRRLLSIPDEAEFANTLAFVLLMEGEKPAVATWVRPDDPAEAESLVQWLLQETHKGLFLAEAAPYPVGDEVE
ncbi:MAG: hypothetical protein ACYCPN_07195 [Thermoplasmata archaeon]